MIKKAFFIFTFCIAFANIVFAQIEKPISWSYWSKKTGRGEATLYLKATMNSKWHIYSLHTSMLPLATKFVFNKSKDYALVGKTEEPRPVKKYDKNLKTDLTYFEKYVVFTQKIKLNTQSTRIKGVVEFTACNEKSCLPATEQPFSILIQ